MDNVPEVFIFAPATVNDVVALTVEPCSVVLVVMLLAVEIVPNPLAILPVANAPVPVKLEYVPLIAADCNNPVPEINWVPL